MWPCSTAANKLLASGGPHATGCRVTLTNPKKPAPLRRGRAVGPASCTSAPRRLAGSLNTRTSQQYRHTKTHRQCSAGLALNGTRPPSAGRRAAGGGRRAATLVPHGSGAAAGSTADGADQTAL